VCCSVLQCVGRCVSPSYLETSAVTLIFEIFHLCVLQCVAVFSSMLQCVEVCRSVLQSVAVC